MILALHSDASYLSKPESKSRAAGHYYLANKDDDDFSNGAVLTLSKIIKHVMTSASEAKVAALFYNCKVACQNGYLREPFLGSTIIYRGHFHIHGFGYVFHGIKMNSLRLRWISKEGQ